MRRLHTVVETPAFLRQAKREGMTEAERIAAVNLVAANPLAGDAIPGAGGFRKVRAGGKGKGKSGGYRIVTLPLGDDHPVFLQAVLAKGSRENFSDAEINAFAEVAEAIKAALRKRRSR